MANLKTTKGLTALQSKAVTVGLVALAAKLVLEVVGSVLVVAISVLGLI